MIHIYRYI